MAAITGDRDQGDSHKSVFLVTRRELAVLAFALSLVVGSILLLLVTGGHLASALLGPT